MGGKGGRVKEGGRTEEARGSRRCKKAGREGEEEELRKGETSKREAGQTSAVSQSS